MSLSDRTRSSPVQVRESFSETPMRTTTVLTMLTSASMIAFLPVRSAEARFAAPGAAVVSSAKTQITGLYNLTLVG